MAKKQRPARDVVQDRGDGEFWIDHAFLVPEDQPWLSTCERLTLWNVDVPEGFLAGLPQLWWLDLRGGSRSELGVAAGCTKLRYLRVAHVRGLSDVSLLTTFTSLELLALYGLAKVEAIPCLKGLQQLIRVELGQLRGLQGMGGVLDAPNLRELRLLRKITMTDADIDRIASHPTLAEFGWETDGAVAAKVWRPVKERIDLPAPTPLHAIDWFAR